MVYLLHPGPPASIPASGVWASRTLQTMPAGRRDPRHGPAVTNEWISLHPDPYTMDQLLCFDSVISCCQFQEMQVNSCSIHHYVWNL